MYIIDKQIEVLLDEFVHIVRLAALWSQNKGFEE